MKYCTYYLGKDVRIYTFPNKSKKIQDVPYELQLCTGVDWKGFPLYYLGAVCVFSVTFTNKYNLTMHCMCIALAVLVISCSVSIIQCINHPIFNRFTAITFILVHWNTDMKLLSILSFQ